MGKRMAYRKRIGRKGVGPGCLSEQLEWASKGQATGYKTAEAFVEEMNQGLLPTPAQRDYKGSNPANPRDGLDSLIESGATKGQTGQRTGMKLQPAFVLWMMGFPTDWLDLPDGE
jgi:hypothetical protein